MASATERPDLKFRDHTRATFERLSLENQIKTAFQAIMEERGGDPQYNMYVLATLATNGTMADLVQITTLWLKHGVEAVW